MGLDDANERIPVSSSLEEVYGESLTEETRARYAGVREAFEKAYDGRSPEAFARSPGRVNLIGEHIDYEGYSVLPMAIGLDTIVAVSVNEKSGKITCLLYTSPSPRDRG